VSSSLLSSIRNLSKNRILISKEKISKCSAKYLPISNMDMSLRDKRLRLLVLPETSVSLEGRGGMYINFGSRLTMPCSPQIWPSRGVEYVPLSTLL
jgi:hypothetical protein